MEKGISHGISRNRQARAEAGRKNGPLEVGLRKLTVLGALTLVAAALGGWRRTAARAHIALPLRTLSFLVLGAPPGTSVVELHILPHNCQLFGLMH